MVPKLILIAAFCIMAGCQTVPKGSFCSIASPIRPSRATIDAMSDREVAEFLSFLEKGKRLCGWKP